MELKTNFGSINKLNNIFHYTNAYVYYNPISLSDKNVKFPINLNKVFLNAFLK